MANISVLGAGGWGLGLAMLLNNNGHNVTVWSVLKDEVEALQRDREHKRCLPGVIIPEKIIIKKYLKNLLSNEEENYVIVYGPHTPFLKPVYDLHSKYRIKSCFVRKSRN